MASRGKTHRVWTWVAGIGLVLGLGLFLLHIYHQGERPDVASAALAAYEQKDWPKAADLARARLKAAASDVDALRILARASIRMGRDPAGITIYNDRLSTENMQPEDFFLLGWTLIRQGNEELAVKVWSKTCLTCHDPHRDADRSPAFYERKCLECHSTVGAIPGVAANQPRLKASSGPERNSKARPTASVCKVNPAHGCLSCHMPKVRIPVLHTSLTDHYIRVHREK